MLNNRKQSSASFVRRKRQVRRLLLETLERRECMAFDFTFAGGILNIIGDEEPNVIEIFQPRDRVVEVNGDGVLRTFEGVDSVFVATLGGGDKASSSKPKEIVVVGSKIKFDMGAGNDEVRIDDGGATRKPAVFNAAMDVEVDLGTGIDDFRMDVRRHDSLNLDLTTEDGSDKIRIGLLLPAVQKVREAAARIDLDLKGSNYFVDVRLENIEDVDLSLVSDSASPEPVTGGEINMYWHAIDSSRGIVDGVKWKSIVLKRGYGGFTEPRTPGDSLVTFSFLATAGGANEPTSVNAALHLGPEDDTVSVLSHNVDDLQLDLSTGIGDDKVMVEVSKKEHPDFLWFPTGLNAAIDLAPIMNISIDTGAGNDTVEVDSSSPGVGFLRSIDAGRVSYNVDLGDGDDRLAIDMSGYANVNGLIAAGDGNDKIHIRHRMFAIVDRSQLKLNVQLGLGSDILVLETFNYRDFETTIDRGPAGDGRDTVVTRHVAPSRGRGSLSRIRLRLDGGQDTGDFSATGYDTHNVQQIGDTATHEVGHW